MAHRAVGCSGKRAWWLKYLRSLSDDLRDRRPSSSRVVTSSRSSGRFECHRVSGRSDRGSLPVGPRRSRLLPDWRISLPVAVDGIRDYSRTGGDRCPAASTVFATTPERPRNTPGCVHRVHRVREYSRTRRHHSRRCPGRLGVILRDRIEVRLSREIARARLTATDQLPGRHCRGSGVRPMPCPPFPSCRP